MPRIYETIAAGTNRTQATRTEETDETFQGAGSVSDADAIHDNVAAEIAAIAIKGTPVSGDLLVIEDSAAANAKKSVTVGSLPGGSGTDADAIHDNVAAEISAVTLKGTPVSGDHLLIEDSAAANAKKRITVGSLPGGGSATTSALFITNATGSGTISNKSYEANTVPGNHVLEAFESDNNNITVTVEIHVINTSWQPTNVVLSGAGGSDVTVLKQNWTQLVSNSRIYTAACNMTDASASDATLTATLSDGNTATVDYTRSLNPPLVLTAVWDNQGTNADKYPAVQTQYKQGDLMQLSGTAESHANEVYVKDFEATSGQGLQGPYTVTAGVWTAANVVAGSATNGVAKFRCYAKVTGGTAGADKDSTQTADCSQTSPTFSSVGHSYPAGQEALKDVETDTVTITHTNKVATDTHVYTDNSTGELTIPAATTYAASKALVRLSGNYRETGTNYQLTATRTELNGKSATKTATVKIAHTTPVITLAKNSSGTALDRMGSGASSKNQTVYLNSTQANLSTHTPTVALGAGDTAVFTGSWSADGSTRYTRTKQTQDADIAAGGQTPNNYTWGAVSVKNRAGKEATTVTTHTTYSLGGFTTRTINMGPITGGDPPYTHTGDIGVPIVDTSKTAVANTSKGGSPSLAYEGSVVEHNDATPANNNFWTTVNALAGETFDDFTKFFHCSDKKFYDSVTAPGGFNCTVAESET